MSDLTLENISTLAQEPPDEVVLAFFRRFLPDFYFVNASISQMRRHFALIHQLPPHAVILDFHHPAGAQFTKLTLCAHDDIQPGLLSKVAGTLTALKINVSTAWIHTLADPKHPQSGRRVVLDTLILSESRFGRSRPLAPSTQKQVSEALSPLFNEQKSENPLLSKALRLTRGPLQVDEISASPTAQGHLLITLRTPDSSGVLFRVTRALAALQLDIAHAQVNTSENAVDDVFFVSRANGGVLEETEIAALVEELRRLLGSEIW